MYKYKDMTLAQMVKNKSVKFEYFRKDELWYITDDGFQFPVPISDAGDGIFLASDKATLLMRYIRKHLAYLDASIEKEKQNEENYA